MIDEGYIKFECDWKQEAVVTIEDIRMLNPWRDRLYALELVGAYPSGIGFGNISQRLEKGGFLITGTQTGNYAKLKAQHYAQVTKCSVENNHLTCVGMTRASSESMSHYAVYQSVSDCCYVFHTHHVGMWKTWLNRLPTTHPDVRYGTPEMVYEIYRLFRETDVAQQGIFLTAGHEEGIFTFGKTAEEAGRVLLDLFFDRD